MEKILVSACLLGENTRYDGGNNYLQVIEKLKEKYDLIPFCPEVAGGLSTPREPCEIKGLDVVTKDGSSKSKEYNLGAKKALQACKLFGINIAILNESSPSCGVRNIHDGHFNGTKIPGKGITTRLLEENGIHCYSSFDDLSFLFKEEEKKEKEYISYEERGMIKRKKKRDSDKLAYKKKKTFRKKDKEESEEKKPSFEKKSSFKKKTFHKDFKNKKQFHHKDGEKSFNKEKGKKSFGKKSFKKNSFKKSFKGKSSFKGKKSFNKNYSKNKKSA